ncbi:DsbA family protein [Deinococcus puniceus]|uniref:DSBA oxidoreductase n=1 Tax=Deinococcus puniceus TaxID=1182568 RepID=A0A172T9K1_9DEIO|nr:DsbA family protein [Deinococcus puniceus]ANE43681.1 DSBA oxidoreductase [Deinococcus puniceus]
MTRLQGTNPNRTILVIGTLLAAALIALALFAVRGQPSGSTAVVNFDTSSQPVLGQSDAPVTLVVFEDFKCPNCKRFEDEFLPELKTKYIDTGKAKLVSINYPFLAQSARLPTDDSKLAAQAVECAFVQSNDLHESYKSVLFRGQGNESAVWATKSRLKDLAANVEGLDTAKFATCLDNDETAAAVDADEKQAVDAKVAGTPAIYVNGKLVDSYATASVSAAIDAALQN